MKILLKNAAVLDAETEGERRDILIDGEEIAGVKEHIVDPEAREYDCAGKTVMPGFIDSHVHLYSFGLPEEQVVRAFARNGVAAVRDMGILGNMELEPYMAWLRAHEMPGCTRVVTAGRYIDVAGGYGMGPEPNMAWGLEAVSAESAAAHVAYQAAGGVQGIKIGLQDWFPNAPKLPGEYIRAIVEQAHKCALWTTAHIGLVEDLRTIVDCGIDSSAHTPHDKVMDDALIGRMVEQGVPMTTTVGDPEASVAQTPFLPPMYKTKEEYLSAELKSRDIVLENLRRFHEAGGTILVGTDFMHSKDPENDAVIPTLELRYLAEIGMTQREILAAGTVHNAAACHIPDLGLVKKGMKASLIAFDGPLDERFERLMHPPFVMDRGAVVEDRLFGND